MKLPALVTAVCLVATGVGMATPSGTATAAPSTHRASAVDWGRCDDASLRAFGARCGFVSVPLDYSRRDGKKIRLAVSRVAHTATPSKHQGVMLLNPGGPGGSGLGLSTLGAVISEDFGRKDVGGAYDWIGFDPRGVGASEPSLSCDPGYFGPDRPEYLPSTPELLAIWRDRSQGYARACGKAGGRLLGNMRSTDTARDMNEIRKALGAKKINFYGYSYGTYLAAVYTELFPTRMRKMVLDSSVDPRRVWYLANLDQDLAFDRNANLFFDWIARHDSAYHLGASRAAVADRYQQVRAQVATTPIESIVGPSEWDDTFTYAGYVQSLWPDLAELFAGFANSGAGKPVIAAYRNFDTPGDDNGYAVYNAVSCVDDTWKDENFLGDQWATYAKAPFLTWANAWFNGPCYYWPAKASPRTTVTGAGVGRALLVGETLDAATPFSGSLYLRSIFRRSRLVAVPGGTNHAVSPSGNPCVDNKIFSYLASGKLPERKPGPYADARCAPLPEPEPVAAQAFTGGTAGGEARSLLGDAGGAVAGSAAGAGAARRAYLARLLLAAVRP